MVGLLVLGAVVVYQQYQLYALLGTISSQSSELASPSSSLVVSNFTVTKLNATSKPVMILVLWNNGTAPAFSGDFLLGVYGQSKTFQSCYNSSQNFFPIFSNESTMIASPLSCGSVGDGVELTASVNFLTSSGTVSRVFSSRATIEQANYSFPSLVVMNGIGIRTVIVPKPFQGKTIYTWYLSVTNESPSSIVSVRESAVFANGLKTMDEGCFIVQGFVSVSKSSPLPPHVYCQKYPNIPSNLRLTIGEHFSVVVAVTYSDGTNSSASVTATVEPPYILYQ
jgi:hypothetical protein